MRETWSEAALAGLPVKNQFRLRGTQMGRLETFTDASFAFAVTMVVISIDAIPGSFDEFVETLKLVPRSLLKNYFEAQRARAAFPQGARCRAGRVPSQSGQRS